MVLLIIFKSNSVIDMNWIESNRELILFLVPLIAMILEGSHRELPALKVVRSASVKVCFILASYMVIIIYRHLELLSPLYCITMVLDDWTKK